jgi:copper chaperone CopZ
MKNLIILILLFSINSISLAQSIVEKTFKVNGNCSMCKERIETVLDTKGIKAAKWNANSQELFVAFNSNKISEDEIVKLVLSLGHKINGIEPDSMIYSRLPKCCQYKTENCIH